MKKRLKLISLGLLSLLTVFMTVGCNKKDGATTNKPNTSSNNNDSNSSNGNNNNGTVSNTETFTIKFVNEDDSELSTQTVKKGDMPVYNGTPTYTDNTYTYVFSGWDSEIVAATSTKTYKATYTKTFINYEIKFINYNGEEVFAKSDFHYNDSITLPSNPEKDHCEFLGWSLTENGEVVSVDSNVSCNRTYYAIFSGERYTYTFYDHNNNVVKTLKADKGTQIVPADNPERDNTNTKIYTFLGWYTESTGGSKVTTFPTLESDVSYYARFSEETRTYLIKFMNGTIELQSKAYEYGQTPTYTGATPTKTATAEYTYAFSGWSPEVTQVTEEATYVAQFSGTKKQYLIKFMVNNVVEQQGYVDYGETPIYSGNTPTKESTDNYDYTFTGWSPEIATVTGAQTYTAVFAQTAKMYTFIFYNEDGSEVVGTRSAEYGKTVTPPTAPAKASDDEYSYTFDAWYAYGTSRVTNFKVVGNINFYARYNKTAVEYTLSFYYFTGSRYTTITKAWGKEVTAPADPKRDGYTFAGWDKEVPTTMPKENMTFIAKWEGAKYTLTITNTLGSYVTVDGTFGGTGTFEAACEASYRVKVYAPRSYLIKFDFNGTEYTVADNLYEFTMPAKNTTITIKGAPYRYTSSSNTVVFGTYPQSQVTNSTLLSKLNALVTTTPTASNANGWTVYEYYSAETRVNYMWYKDVSYEGDKYRVVYLTAYRPNSFTAATGTSNSNVDNNGYTISGTGSRYWFRFDSITWTINSVEDGKKLLVADLVLDAQMFNNSSREDKFTHGIDNTTTGANGYLASSIREFLLDTFYNTAFDGLAKTIISTRAYTVNTSKLDTVSLISSGTLTSNITLRAKASDYAKIQGVEVDSLNYAPWYLNNSGTSTTSNTKVRYFDATGTGKEKDNYYVLGIRPAILVSVS